jgi:hypothetical protein
MLRNLVVALKIFFDITLKVLRLITFTICLLHANFLNLFANKENIFDLALQQILFNRQRLVYLNLKFVEIILVTHQKIVKLQ